MCLHDADSRNVFNCDEINITNHPGMKKIIFRRGLCQIERKMELSKQSISIMFCGSATGEYLPPMIVCKVQNAYTGWCVAGNPVQYMMQLVLDGSIQELLYAGSLQYF